MAIEDIQTLKQRTDIVAIINKYTELQQRGGEWWGCCPLHEEKTPSFSINPAKGSWHCFGCGAGGDVITFVEKMNHCTTKEAIELLGGNFQHSSNYVPTMTRRTPAQEKPVNNSWQDRLRGSKPVVDTPGEQYLASRGVDINAAMDADVKYHPLWYSDPKINRRGRKAVLFPITDADGNLVGAEGRYIDGLEKTNDAFLKAQSAGRKSLGVFATYRAWQQRYILLAEGPINALSLAMAGFPAIATCGAANLPAWIPERCRGKRIITFFDNDQGGEKGRMKIAHALQKYGLTSRNIPVLIPGFDINDLLVHYGLDAFQREIAKRINSNL